MFLTQVTVLGRRQKDKMAFLPTATLGCILAEDLPSSTFGCQGCMAVISPADDGKNVEGRLGTSFRARLGGGEWSAGVTAPGSGSPGHRKAAEPVRRGPAAPAGGNHTGARNTAFGERPTAFARQRERQVRGAGQ